MLGYLSYLAGELAGLSGIVTLFCAAVAISHYALHNISAPARVTLVRSCQTLSYVSEGAIFIYVGMDTLDPLKWKVCPLCFSSPDLVALCTAQHQRARPRDPLALVPDAELCQQGSHLYLRGHGHPGSPGTQLFQEVTDLPSSN